ncbi:3'-5' exonuclease [Hafnia paralvei]|nr:3'-5' exonuclease [Hafnia paralvei]MCK2182152.1 3'-5' exonuclease [Hafnia paralvei]
MNMTPQQRLQQKAQSWVGSRYFLLLDTETTGLSENDEIVEICIIDSRGLIMLNTLIKPTKPIPEEATAIHGITNEMVAHAPTWRDVHGVLVALYELHEFVIYNADFDTRMMNQTACLYGLGDGGFSQLLGEYSECAMLAYAEFYGHKDERRGGYKWQKLTNAAEQQGVIIQGSAHRALSDCLTTLGVIKAMAAGGAK